MQEYEKTRICRADRPDLVSTEHCHMLKIANRIKAPMSKRLLAADQVGQDNPRFGDRPEFVYRARHLFRPPRA